MQKRWYAESKNGFRDVKINTTSGMMSLGIWANLGKFANLGTFANLGMFANFPMKNQIIIFCLILMKNIPEIPKKSLWILGNGYRWLSTLIFGHMV